MRGDIRQPLARSKTATVFYGGKIFVLSNTSIADTDWRKRQNARLVRTNREARFTAWRNNTGVPEDTLVVLAEDET